MAEIREPQKALAFCGLIYAPGVKVETIVARLAELGEPVLWSEPFPFTQTDYYENEMGRGLSRQWVVFHQLVYPDMLVDLKHQTNGIEQRQLTRQGNRTINLDPGVVTMGNVVLASTKNSYHRIYLGRGIYAELTLVFHDRRFHALDWTYPDYREARTIDFFARVREMLKLRLAPKGGS